MVSEQGTHKQGSENMTKKHFIAIAETIKWERDQTGSSAGREAIEAVAFALADEFKCFNSSFDKERFITACGF